MLEDLIEQGIPISRKRVARLTQAEGLRARVRERFRFDDDERSRSADRWKNPRPSVPGRERPNQRWVGDTTEFVIGSSARLYLAAIMDLQSRFIVGWALSDERPSPRLVKKRQPQR